MSTIDLTQKIEELKALQALIEEAQQEADTLTDCIKAEMLSRNTEELEAGQYIVRWTTTISNRFNTTAFKKDFPEEYKEYTKPVTSRRFSIA